MAIAILGVLFGVAGFFLGANSASLMTYNPDPDGNRGDAVMPAKTGHEVRGAILSKENLDARLRGPDGNSVVPSSSSATPLSPPVANRFVAPDFRSDPDDKGDAIIAGHVYDRSGKPVSGVEVTCVHSDFWMPGCINLPDVGENPAEHYETTRIYLQSLAKQTRIARTDSNGAFKFMGLATLAYDLAVTTKTIGWARECNVASGDSAVELYLSGTAAVIRGHVRLDSGEPVCTFMLQAVKIIRGAYDDDYSNSLNVIASDDGSFEMGLPEGGQWCVQAYAPGLYQISDRVMGDKEVTVAESGFAVAEIVMTHGVTLSGRVLANGQPVPNIEVNLCSERGFLNNATSNSLGRYRCHGIKPGEYTLSTKIGTWTMEAIPLTIGSEHVEMDLTIVLGATVILNLMDSSGRALMESYTSFVLLLESGDNCYVNERMIKRKLGESCYAGFVPGKYRLEVRVRGRAYKTIETDIHEGENIITVIFPEPCSLQGEVTLGNDGVEIRYLNLRVEVQSIPIQRGEETAIDSCSVRGDGVYAFDEALNSGQVVLRVINDNEGDDIVLYETMLTLVPGENTYGITLPLTNVLVVEVNTPAIDSSHLDIVSRYSYQIRLFPKLNDGEQDARRAYKEFGDSRISFIGIPTGTYTLYAYLGGGIFFAEPFDVTVGEGTTNVTVQFHKANCVRVEYVYPHSQAAEAGIRDGDKIFSYNGEPVNNEKQFKELMSKTTDANSVTIMIDRKGTTFPLTLKGGSLGVNVTNALR
ncbi:MAG: PDZ domain-containing protein [Planctomycetaceae bacterium]|nr:PDZ domain-containing protein [Planctomycetaceae bacterium]